MAPVTPTVISRGFATILQFLATIAVWTLLAYLLRKTVGGRRQTRQAIFSIILVFGIVASLFYMQHGLQHLWTR
jgi:hypothetical protein